MARDPRGLSEPRYQRDPTDMGILEYLALMLLSSLIVGVLT